MSDSAGIYSIVTPAYNEGAVIERTIEGVLAQSVLPARWVIVDDGSTDDTVDRVGQYQRNHPFIQIHRRSRSDAHRYFESNVHALLEGIARLETGSHPYLAILDADMVWEPGYMEGILSRFGAHARLGIASGVYWEDRGRGWERATIDRRATPKALQVFRRECYQQIGGYRVCPFGAEDSCTEVLARMHGWQTWSFPELRAWHLRPSGLGESPSVLRARFRQGFCDYRLGTSIPFMLAKCLRRLVLDRPYGFAAAARLGGYMKGFLIRSERDLPGDAIRFLRREQRWRLLARLGLAAPDWQPGDPVMADPP